MLQCRGLPARSRCCGPLQPRCGPLDAAAPRLPARRCRLRCQPMQASAAPNQAKPGPPDASEQDNRPGRRQPWQRLRLPKSLRLFQPSSSSEDGQPRHDGQQWRVNIRTVLSCLRALALGVLAMAGLSFVRYTAMAQARVAPKEMLYSDFVTLLDAGRVRAARLETTNSRLIFELTHGTAAAAATATAAAAARDAASSSGSELQLSAAGKRHLKEMASASSAAAAAAAATAGAAAVEGQSAASAASKGSSSSSSSSRRFFIKTAEKQDPFLVSRILTSGVEFSVVRASLASQLGNVVASALAIWLPLLPLWFFARRIIDARTGSSSSSSKKAKRPADQPRVTFADVAGVGAAKEELREVVACLKNAGQYSKVRARTPSGVLLCGPPGTGKTLLAKAVAGEAGVPFLSVSASEFVELFVGRGAARVRELFAEARKSSPCVVFIDELDAMGARRGMGYNDERDQTLIQLLTELDGFEGRQGVVLLAATNRPDVLDPALTRPGRLSRKVVVPLPDEAGRAAILGVHLKELPLDPDTAGDQGSVVRQLAAVTPRFSGAELANVVNEAALLAARRGAELVGLQDLLDGVQRTRFGVNGGAKPPGSALQRRLSSWLLQSVAREGGRPVKVSTA